MEKYYAFSGVEIAVNIPQDRMYQGEQALAPFRVDAVSEPHRFRFEAADRLCPPAGTLVASPPDLRIYRDGPREIRYLGAVDEDWANGYLRTDSLEKEHRIQFRPAKFSGIISAKTVLDAMGAEHLIARAGGFVFHCAFIEWQGKAILFTAPSGTGKSTQAELWKIHRNARILNGDRAAIRLSGGQLTAEGIPFCGSSPYCEKASLPIRAIVYLAQGKENLVKPLGGYAAFSRLWEGVSVNTWDAEDLQLVSAAVQETVRQVPVYHFSCTADERAVTALETILREGESQ